MSLFSKILARGCLWAVLCIFALGASAADQPVRFVVPDSQIKALGIKTTTLQNSAESVRASFPAQVTVPPNAEQVVSSPVAGLITNILVEQNQLVRLGAQLLRIASPELGELQLQLLQADTRATLARQTVQREKKLFDEGIIPERRLQEAQAAASEGEAALTLAKAALRLAGMTGTTINQVVASGDPEDGVTIVARKAGVVTEIEVTTGQRVSAASALMHIAQTDTLWLDIQVPVTDSAAWQPGTAVRVQGRDISGRVLSSSAVVSSGSQTVVLRAELDGMKGELRPGEFVTVELPVKATPGAGISRWPLSLMTAMPRWSSSAPRMVSRHGR